MKTYEVKQAIKKRYSKCAEVGDATTTCCCSSEPPANSSYATEHGLYSKKELSLVPEISRSLSRGCGNPTGFAELQPGEVVVDFGCGAGIDAILAAHKVMPGGKCPLRKFLKWILLMMPISHTLKIKRNKNIICNKRLYINEKTKELY